MLHFQSCNFTSPTRCYTATLLLQASLRSSECAVKYFIGNVLPFFLLLCKKSFQSLMRSSYNFHFFSLRLLQLVWATVGGIIWVSFHCYVTRNSYIDPHRFRSRSTNYCTGRRHGFPCIFCLNFLPVSIFRYIISKHKQLEKKSLTATLSIVLAIAQPNNNRRLWSHLPNDLITRFLV
jgi:hypothetical protein